MIAERTSRREFLKITAGVGAGLVLGCRLEAGDLGASGEQASKDWQANAFVSVAPTGDVMITVPRPDIGQGVRTSLAMVVAEELGVDWQKVQVSQAPGDRQTYGGQGVGGSSSIRGSWGPMRVAGATAALMIRQAAAAKWGVGVDTVSIANGVVKSGSKSGKIGDFATDAAKLPVPERSALSYKSKSEYTVVGKPSKRVDNHDVVTGKAKYGLDTKLPGMKVAMIARPPAFGGKAASYDAAAAKAVEGVREVFEIPSGVVVVADDTWRAHKGVQALNPQWDAGPTAAFSTAELSKAFKAAVQPFPDMPAGAKTLEAEYELPFLSHSTMEPMNCTAHVTDSECILWAPTQAPDSMRDLAARLTGLDPSKVTVNVPIIGGGFGRRFNPDFVEEAVIISQKIKAPVQVVWTRSDDTKHDFYRPANFHALKGAVGADGMPSVFLQQTYLAGRARGRGGSWGTLRMPYKLANAQIMEGAVPSPVPTGAWRSVEHTYTIFTQEAFFDELCHLGGQDPVKARLALLTDDRLKRTLEMCAEKAGWDKPLPKGWGRGVACFAGYGSCITQIAEVEHKDGEIKVRRVVAVVDCGLAINPLGVQAQVEGATMDAVSTALGVKIVVQNGGVRQLNFGDIGWGRIGDAPRMEVHVIGDGDSPGGMGEVGYPAAVPAILNAIFAATGQRIRRLPANDELE